MDSVSKLEPYAYDQVTEDILTTTIAAMEMSAPEMYYADLLRILDPFFQKDGEFQKFSGAFRRRFKLGEFEWIPGKGLYFRRVEYVRRPQKPTEATSIQ